MATAQGAGPGAARLPLILGALVAALVVPAGLIGGAFAAPVAGLPDAGHIVRWGLPIGRAVHDLAAASAGGPRCVAPTGRLGGDKGLGGKIVQFPCRAIGRALIHGEPDGFVKIVADQTGRILGTHIVGNQATELISEPALAQLFQGDAWEVGRNVHPHPTLSEAVGEAAMAVDGQALNI